jgi:hypothetical protein
MFIQIIQGTCTRQTEVRALAERWRDELSSGGHGWLGGTYGFTNDDMFIGVVRFTSRAEAMANSERPEVGEFARQMMALMDGPVQFHDCDDVTLMMDGGSDSAGFVQVIRGRVEDPLGFKALMADTEVLHELRPEIIGATLALEEDGTFTETVAFTDEASAREGEGRMYPDMPDEQRKVLESALSGATFWDIREPWFESP